MVNIELLKKIVFVADITQRLEPIDFDDFEIKLNVLIENYEQVEYALTVLKIPYTTYEIDKSPEELNVVYGASNDLKIIYLITYILKEIFDDSINVYMSYATVPEDRKFETLIGSYITEERNYTNVSAPVKPLEILRLDILNLDRETFNRNFPNNNYSTDGYCGFYSFDTNDYDDNDGHENHDNYASTYEKYNGYNDWSDDIIDDVFDGDPGATWNID